MRRSTLFAVALTAATFAAGAAVSEAQEQEPNLADARAAYQRLQIEVWRSEAATTVSTQFLRINQCATSGNAAAAFDAANLWRFTYEVSECIRLYADPLHSWQDLTTAAYTRFNAMVAEAAGFHGSPQGEALILQATFYAVGVGDFISSGGAW